MSLHWSGGQQTGSIRWWEKSTKKQSFMHFIRSGSGETPRYPSWGRHWCNADGPLWESSLTPPSKLQLPLLSMSCYFSRGEFSQLSHLWKGFGMIKSIILLCRISLLSASSLILYNTSLMPEVEVLVIETLAFQSLTLMDTSFSPALFAFLQIWDNWTIASYTFILSQAPSQMKFQLVGIFREGRALMIPDEHLLLCTICYSGQKSSADLMFKQLIIWACHKRTSGIIPSNLSWQKQVLDNMAQHSFKIQLDLKKCPLMWNWSLLWGDDSDGWLFSC